MQTVKTFIYGRNEKTNEFSRVPLDDQINAFLKEHQDHKIVSMSTVNASGYKEAFIVFDIREERNFNRPKNDKNTEGNKQRS